MAVVFCWVIYVQKGVAGKSKYDPWHGIDQKGNITITKDAMNEILSEHQQWLSEQKEANHRFWQRNDHLKGKRFYFYKVKLRGMIPRGANLEKAGLIECDLREVLFWASNFRKIDFYGSDLSNSSFFWLEDIFNPVYADLRGARFKDVRLTGADMHGADLEGAIFEPKPGQLPEITSLVTAKNLTKMTYEDSPRGLVELREAFKKTGMRKQEREMTFAIKHNERIKESGWFWSGIQYAFFEFPVGWGLYPERALFIMAGLIPLFAVLYYFPLGLGTWRGGTIWMRWREGRATNLSESDQPRPLKRMGWRRAAFAFYFSLLSAFHIGWRELNVGTWISRIQPREYTLQATGWPRVISGVQSLISVYLLALAVLSYFGRPFE